MKAGPSLMAMKVTKSEEGEKPSLRTGRALTMLEVEALLRQATPPWHQRPLVSLTTAAALLCCSKSQIYCLAHRHELVLRKIAGRTAVETHGIVQLLSGLAEWTPSTTRGGALVERRLRSRSNEYTSTNMLDGPPGASDAGPTAGPRPTQPPDKHNAARGF
jgi:hypothetical protein